MSVTKKSLPLLLESLKILHDNRITNAGVMLFARDPGRFLMHCQMHLVAFKGVDRVNIYDKKYVRDDLLTQFNEAVAFCEKHLNERAEIRGVNRYDIYEIPIEAIREAIVNAIIHRDYSVGGTNIQVEVHADRVEISNPGGLPPGFSTAMLGKKSVRRNEVIADLFHRMDKSERMGSGISRIRKLLKTAGVKAPGFESNMFFTVTFERPEEYRSVKDTLKGSPTTPETARLHYHRHPLSQTAQALLQLIKTKPEITRAEMATELGITVDGVKYHIKRLQGLGKIRHTGPTKRGRWECL